MKLDNLKQLVKEELTKAMNDRDLKDMPLGNMEEGTYEIEYIVADSDGGPDYSDSDIVTITQDEFSRNMDVSNSNFWKGTVRDLAKFPIYKITKVTRA
jgi:hypothetical protein